MTTARSRLLVGATALLSFIACDDSPTDPGLDGPNDAVIEGRVDETTAGSSASGAPARAPGSTAETVSVVHIGASGEYTELASADVQVDGRYRVEGVPSGTASTAVVAWVDGRSAGEVLVHGEIRSGETVRVAPITYETTMETRAYAHLVGTGGARHTSTSEVALFLHAEGPEVETALHSEAELGVISQGSAEAGATMGAVFADAGVALDASTRSTLLLDSAVDLAADLLAGLSLGAAQEDYADAAIDAYVGAGADFESVIMATAAAATTFDAALEGRTGLRGPLLVQPLRMNLRARERAAASHGASAEAELAAAVEVSLAEAWTAIQATTTASEVKAALEARLQATLDATADATVELLAREASLTTRAEVRAAAEAALVEATLETRLRGQATASAAATAVTDYRSRVRSAVQAMVDLVQDASVDVDVITELFIAAGGGASVA